MMPLSFNECNKNMTRLLEDQPLGVIRNGVDIPSGWAVNQGFSLIAKGSMRATLMQMEIGDHIRLSKEDGGSFASAGCSYGDGWSTVRRTLPNGSVVIWKKEKKGYIGSLLRSYDKQGRLDAYREHVKEQIANL